jgi:hypothetical protein
LLKFEEEDETVNVLVLAGLGLGAPKKDVILPLALGFFASHAGVDRWLALRLSPGGLAMTRFLCV